MQKLPISLVIICLNEERNIARCLKSVPFASEVLVVDSGSTDRTGEIVKANGGRFLHHDWAGFGPQKKFAAQAAKYDWVLSLDADEALTPELAREIQDKFAQLDPEHAIAFPRKSFYLGRWILHGGWYPDWQIRLFNRQHSMWTEAPVHEKIQSRKVVKFQSDLEHYVFRDLAHQVETNNRYSSLQAKQHRLMNQRFSFYKMLVKPFVKFWECYLLKQGYKDGLAGFVIAIGAAHSVFIRWVKVWEQEQ